MLFRLPCSLAPTSLPQMFFLGSQTNHWHVAPFWYFPPPKTAPDPLWKMKALLEERFIKMKSVGAWCLGKSKGDIHDTLFHILVLYWWLGLNYGVLNMSFHFLKIKSEVHYVEFCYSFRLSNIPYIWKKDVSSVVGRTRQGKKWSLSPSHFHSDATC